jgi:DNA-binding transcriptional LysR family regulator
VRAAEIRNLVVLDRILAERSVKRAAEQLGVTPSAVSHALAALRDHFDDPLVVRQRGVLVLTARAERLAPRLRAAIAHLDELDEPVFQPASATSAFTFAAADLATAVVLPPLLDQLAKTAPHVQVRVVSPEPDPFAQLDGGRADLVTGLFDDAPAGYRYQRLFEDSYVLVMRQRHASLRKPLTLGALAELAYVTVSPRSTANPTRVDRALAKEGLARRIVATVPQFLTALQLIAASDLVGILPTRIATGPGVATRELPVKLPSFAIAQIWPERLQLDPSHRWFREHVKLTVRSS